MVRLGGRGYLENLSTEFEKDIRNSLLYHGSLPRHVPRQQRRPTPLGRLEDAYCHDLRKIATPEPDFFFLLGPSPRAEPEYVHPQGNEGRLFGDMEAVRVVVGFRSRK